MVKCNYFVAYNSIMDNDEQKFREILAINIRVARTRKKLTQEQLGELTGISDKHITKIENAKVTTNIYYIYRIANVLNISIDELVTEYKN